MSLFTRTLIDPFADCDALRRARYGVIETREGALASIRLRAWPKIATALEARSNGRRFHRCRPGDRCWLYYNQPRGLSQFLALKYVVSARGCTLATFQRALAVLDLVAQVKGTDAIVCDAWNLRLSDRLMARWGWEPHNPSCYHRHFIKRFYGVYPAERPDVRQAAVCS